MNELNDQKINVRRRIRIKFDKPSLTQQQYKDEVNINNIVNRYKNTGEIQETGRKGYYMDVSSVPDYQTALEIVNNANRIFQTLPAKIRTRFGGNPAEMLKFLDDPQNMEEAKELGFIDKPTEKTVEKTVEKKDDQKVEKTS